MKQYPWRRWLKSLFGAGSKRGRRPTRSLAVETLETRVTPTTYTWQGGSGVLWSKPANWAGGVAPITTTPADSLVFDNTSSPAFRSSVDDIAGLNVGSITISGSGYTLAATTGSEITLGSTTGLFGGGGLLQVGGISGLTGTISININLGGASSNFTTDNIKVDSGASLTLAGNLRSKSNVELISNGVGALILSADNSGAGNTANALNGPIDVTAGTLSITNGNALGNGSASNTVRVENGATLQLDNSTGTLSSPITQTLLVNGAGSSGQGALYYLNGGNNNNATWSGPIELDSTTTFGASSFVGNSAVTGQGQGTLTISGVINDGSGPSSLIKEGTGEIIFSGTNTYRGNTTINNGILVAANNWAMGHGPINGKSNADNLLGTATIVNSTLSETGTFELDGSLAPGGNITLANQLLVLNGPAGLNPPNLGPDGALTGSITGATGTGVSPIVITTTSTAGLTNNSTVFISGMVGNTAANNLPWTITVLSATQFSLSNSTGNGNYLGNGSWRLNGAVVDNIRGNNTWAGNVLLNSNAPSIGAFGQANVLQSSNSSLTLGGINTQTGTPTTILQGNITNATGNGVSPIVITTTSTAGLVSGETVHIDGMTGNTAADALPWTITVVNSTQFSLNGSTGNGAYTGGGIYRLGVVSGPNQFIKVGNGTVILTTDNSYTQPTKINAGVLEIESNGALGLGSSNTVVAAGSTLELADDFRLLNNLAPTNQLTILNFLSISGNGYGIGGGNTLGALYSHNGINTYTGQVAIAGSAAIGVDPPPIPTGAPYTYDVSSTGTVLDDSLMITSGGISGGALTKVGTGQLILPTANQYQGGTTISQGWVTIESNTSLGSTNTALGAGVQPSTTVAAGAALHLLSLSSTPVNEQQTITFNGVTGGAFELNLNGGSRTAGPILWDPDPIILASNIQNALNAVGVIGPTGTQVVYNPAANNFTVTFSGPLVANTYFVPMVGGGNTTGNITVTVTVAGSAGPMNLTNNMNLSGTGVTLPGYPLVNQQGALMNLAGTNTVSGNIVFNGQVGIGVEQIYTGNTTTVNVANPSNVLSQLSLAGQQLDGLSSGGIEKLGTQRLSLQGPGSYTGAVNVRQGVLLNQNNTGLGSGVGTTTVLAGAALELANGIGANNGGVVAGIQIPNEHLVLFGPGNSTFGDAPLTVLSNNVGYEQVLSLTGATPGTTPTQYFLSFNGVTSTVPVSYTGVAATDAASIQSTLTALSTIGGVGGSVSVQADATDTSYTIVFGGTLAGTVLPLSASVAQTAAIATVFASAGPIANPMVPTQNMWNGPVSLNTAIPVTFQGTLAAKSQPTMTANTLALKGTNATINVTTTTAGGTSIYAVQTAGQTFSAVQTLTFGGNITGGSFTLTLGAQTTAPISWSNNAATLVANIQKALDTLLGAGKVVVSPPLGVAIQVQPNLTGQSESGLILAGAIDDQGVAFVDGSDLTLSGAGELAFYGSNTYRGTTTIGANVVLTAANNKALGNSGVAEMQTLTFTNAVAGATQFTLNFNGLVTNPITLTNNPSKDAGTIQSALLALANIGGSADMGGSLLVSTPSTQLTATTVYTVTFSGSLFGFNQPQLTATMTGAPGTATVQVATLQDGAGATIVANGGSLQLQGNITVSGEPLLVQGSGLNATPNVPQQWFSVGPAPILNGQTAGNNSVSGRINSIVVDPTDPNTIYIATAGGGAWKTIDGGQTWRPLFDGIPEVQQLVLTGATPGLTQFTLAGASGSSGDTTAPILFTGAPNDAITIQNALNGLLSIGGADGFVTVTQTSNGVFSVTFSGGTLNGVSVPPLTPNVTTGPGTLNVTVTTNAVGSAVALYTGAITLDSSHPQTIFLGTGDTNNAPDSFYSTGVYESTNSGATWTLLTGNGATVNTSLIPNPAGGPGTQNTQTTVANPFYGKGISAMVYDPLTGNLYVADGDGSPGRNEIQTITFNGYNGAVNSGNPDQYFITFDDGTTQQTTNQLTFQGVASQGQTDVADAAIIQAALNSLPNIGGVGGSVIVSPVPQSNGRGNPQTLTFTNAVSGGATPTQFTISFRFSTTPVITYTGNGATDALAIQTALNNLQSIGGSNSSVTVTADPTDTVFTVSFSGSVTQGGFGKGGGGGFVSPLNVRITQSAATVNLGGFGFGGKGTQFTVQFLGTLSLNTFPLLTISPQPHSGPNVPPPNWDVQESAKGGPLTVVNGTQGSPGIWRINPSQVATLNPNGAWFDVTNVVSVNRGSTPTTNASDPVINTATMYPNTPGPDDDYRVSFPQQTATWSSLALTTRNNTTTLYAALGSATGSISNGVFHTTNPTSFSPVWLLGSTLISINPNTNLIDAENASEFPAGTLPTTAPTPAFPVLNGTIKISAVNTTLPQGMYNTLQPNYINQPTVYASVTAPNGSLRGIWVSPNGGQEWFAIPSLPSISFMSKNGGQGQGGNYDSAILVDPTNPLIVYVAGQVNSLTSETAQIWRTTDGGVTWTDISVSNSGSGPHTEQHAIAYDPTTGSIYFGNDGGIWKYSPATGQYTDVNGNLAITQINSVATNPTTSNSVLAGSQMNGTDLYSGGKWTNVNNLPTGNALNGGQVAFNPLNANIAYSVGSLPSNLNATTLYQSTDGGNTWNPTSLTVPLQSASHLSIFPFVLDPLNPTRLVVGGNTNPPLLTKGMSAPGLPAGGVILVQSLDGGQTWTNLGANLQATLQSITGIGMATYQGIFAADPGFPNVTDQGSNSSATSTIYVTDGTNIFATKDNGQTWQDRSTGTSLATLGFIQQLVVDPTNRDTVYAVRGAFGGGQVYQSIDGGQTWNNISNNLPNVPAWSLVIDPRTDTLYVGNDAGVYASTNQGTSWSLFGSGMPDVQVHSLDLNQITNTLTAGTYGRGVFQLNLDFAQGAKQLLILNGATTAPVTTQFNLTFGSAQTSPIAYTGNALTDADSIQSALSALATVSGSGGTVSVTANADDSIFTIVFGGSLAGTNQLVVVAVTGSSATASITPSSGGAFTAVSGTSTWTGPVILAGDAAFGADGTQHLHNGVSAAQVSIPGTISDVSPSSNFKVTKVGDGTVVFAGANLYAGRTEVQQGVLDINNALALAGFDTIVDVGAALYLESSLNLEPITLNGDGISFNGHHTGALRNVSHFNTYTGTLTLGTNSTIGVDSGSGLIIGDGQGNGTIKGNFDLVKELTGALILKDADTFGPGSSFVVPNLLNDPANITYPAGLVIAQGTVLIQNSNALGAATNTVTVLDGSQLQLQASQVGGITVPQTLRLSGTGSVSAGALVSLGGVNVWQGNITLAQDAGFNFSTSPPTSVSIGVSPPSQASPNDSLTITGLISQANKSLPTSPPTTQTNLPALGLDKVGQGVLILNPNGNNTYRGGTTVDAGALRIEQSSALGANGSTTVVNAGASLQLSGGVAGLTISGQSLILNGSGTSIGLETGTGSGNAGALENLSGNNTWAGSVTLASNSLIGVDSASGVPTKLTLSGVIQDPVPEFTFPATTASSLTKVGTGTLILASANTYAGSTFINQGVLNIQDDSALGVPLNAVQTFTVTGPLTSSFQLTFKGQPTGPLPVGSSAQTVQNALNSLSSINSNGGSVSVAFNSTNSVYTVTFDGGPLAGNAQPILGASITVGTIVVTPSFDGSHGTVVASGASLQLQGTALNITTEPLTLNGSGFNNGGALENVSGGNTWSGNIILASTSSVGVDNAGDTLFLPGVLSDVGNKSGLTKFGPGTVQYEGAATNTYTGLTTVQAGTLQFNMGPGAFALTGNLAVGTGSGPGATVIDLASNQLPSSGVNVTVNSDGLWNLNGFAETVGQLQISDGTVQTGDPGSLNTLLPLLMTGGSIVTGGAASSVTLNQKVVASADANGNPATISGGGSLVLGSSQIFQVNGPGKLAPAPDMIVSTVISDSISPGSGLNKQGNGILELTANNTYTGTTTIGQGTLLADGPTSANTVGSVALAGGTLGGTGKVGSITTTTGGTVRPGSNSKPFGTLTSASSVSWNPTDTFSFSLGSAGQASLLNINGGLNINGAQLTGTATSTYAPGTTFTILTTAGALGSSQFAGGNVVYVGTQAFSVTYNQTPVGGPNSIILTRVATPVAVTLSANPTGSAVFGQVVTLTATVAPTQGGIPAPNGNSVDFLEGSTVLGTANTNAQGQAILTLANLPLGSHTITASFNGGTQYTITGSPPSISETINQATTTTALTFNANSPVTGQTVILTATVSANSPSSGIPTGTVTFKDGATTLSSSPLNASGVATFTVPNFTVATHNITATYNTDGNYAGSSTQSSLTVGLASTTTALSVSPSGSLVAGQSLTFTATVTANSPGSGTPTGTVTFKDGASTLGTGSLNGSGQATFTTTSLLASSHNITASYGGDNNYTASASPSSNLAIGADLTTTTLNVAPSGSLVAGQPVTLTATVSVNSPGAVALGATQITFSDNGNVIGTATINAGGVATLSTSLLAGTNNLQVSYPGDTNHQSSTGSQSINASQASTTTTLAANPSGNLTFGQSVTYTATVKAGLPSTGVPTGTVTFKDGATQIGTGTLDSSGNASFSISSLTIGSHTITAVYNSDGNYSSSTSSQLIQKVTGASTTVIASANPSPSTFGQSVTFTIQVQGPTPVSLTPTGSVTLKDGSTTVGTGNLDASGNTTISTSSLAIGSHTITAVYSGDNNYGSSTSSSVTQKVTGTSTTVIASANPNPSSFGQSVTFTVQVQGPSPSSPTPTGSITFKDGSTTVGSGNLDVSGNATFSSSTLALGSHTITAVYSGDSNYSTSTSSPVSQKVLSLSTTVFVSANPNPATIGQSVSLVVQVQGQTPSSPTPTGSITFMSGPNNLGTGTLTGGILSTSVTLPITINAGSQSITATYSGDGFYATSLGSVNLTVNPATTTTVLSPASSSGTFGTAPSITATVSSTAGTPSGSVIFTATSGGTVAGTQTVNLNASGQATFTLPSLNVANYTITATYSSNGNFAGSTSSGVAYSVTPIGTTTNLSLSGSSAIFSQPVSLIAKVTANSPTSAIPSGTVTFLDGSATLGNATLDATGTATLSASNIGAGNHSITALYSASSNFGTSTSAASPLSISKGSTTTTLNSAQPISVTGQSVLFTATLTDNSPGTAPPAGTVTFKDGTTTLGTATLNSPGSGTTATATLSLSTLAFGSHNITAVYNGNGNFNGSNVATITQTVARATTTSLVSSVNPFLVSPGTGSLTATVTSAFGVPTGSVTFTFNGGNPQFVNLTSGRAVLQLATVGLTPGVYSVSVQYGGVAPTFGASSFGIAGSDTKLPLNLTVVGTLDHLSTGTASGLSGVAFTIPAGTIQALDINGRTVTNYTAKVNITLNASSPAATLNGKSVVTTTLVGGKLPALALTIVPKTAILVPTIFTLDVTDLTSGQVTTLTITLSPPKTRRT